MTVVRRFGIAVVSVGLLVGLTACGASSDSTANRQGGSQQLAVLSESKFAPALAEAQAKADTVHIEATVDAMGQSGKLSADIKGLKTPATVAMHMSINVSGQPLQLVVVDRALYVKGTGFMSSPDKPWLKVNVGDANNPLAKLFDSANPAAYAAYLKGITRLTDEGVQTVDGVQTRHYSVTVDAAKMLAGNPAFQGQSAASLGVPRIVKGDVYVDSKNLPVKMTVSMGKVASFEAHFSRYGEPVSVQAPPADQVREFSL